MKLSEKAANSKSRKNKLCELDFYSGTSRQSEARICSPLTLFVISNAAMAILFKRIVAIWTKKNY